MKEDKKNVQSLTSLRTKNQELEKELENLLVKVEELTRSLDEKEANMTNLQRSRLLKLLDVKHLKQLFKNAAAYALGRRNLKRLYSKTYKGKQASNDLLPYMRLLYEEGFNEKALADLRSMYDMTSNPYIKRAIAQELALYYANKETKEAAEISLIYIETAKKHEVNNTIKRQLAIIEAECLLRIGKVEQAQQVLFKQILTNKHRDLYLAYANTESTLEKRLYWLNKTLENEQRKPIIFKAPISYAKLTYETLNKTAVAGKDVSGPKISVILPAYNAADSIHLAIESMLKQTWTNIELLIVDDCSTDDTYAVMEDYAKKDARIKLFQTPENSGPYRARNIALQAATGEFVTVNDADDWSHREKLSVQAMHLIESPNVIANTSELARLTSDFMFYRRGTRGKYIFSNMSSLMFRRKEVIERIGYWDEVRFAADGEFKRRLVREFGKNAIVDLTTGPLSLPEQSTGSLTGSSAFGYAGFFMGARKEYVDSFTDYHNRAESLYYPKSPENRPFPIPEPMLPKSKRERRNIDIIIVANFYDMPKKRADMIIKQIEKNKEKNLSTGLVQMYDYDQHAKTRKFDDKIRQIIDGRKVQMIVYGEKIKSQIVFIYSPESLQEKQEYIPQINNRITVIIIDELPKVAYNSMKTKNYNIRQMIRQSAMYFSDEIRLYPLNDAIRQRLESNYKGELGNIRLPIDNWLMDNKDELYNKRLEDWLVERHNYKLI